MTMRRKQTKIVATISDLNCSEELIKKLYDNGLDVVRLNTAHQTHEDALKVIKIVRKVSDRIAILVDTKGPEVRTSLADGEIFLKKGDSINVSYGPVDQESTKQNVYVSYENIVADVPKGSNILIDDGELEFIVQSKTKDVLVCKVMNDGSFKSKKSVNVPGVHLEMPSLTKKDKDFVKFAIEQDIEFIAHSFVRNKADVIDIQRILDKHNSKIKIIAKIENAEGVKNLDEILDYAYGVMVARGDLGIEIPMDEVPGVQKAMIRRCIERQRPVITATQMLHTMIKNPRPTRAEVSDVANAIYDGTDAIMLSGETAYGDYPVEAVKTMATIAKTIEAQKPAMKNLPTFNTKSRTRSFLARSAILASLDLPLKAIIVQSTGGHSARVLSAYRGQNPIYVKSFDMRPVRELALSYGVYAYLMKETKSMDVLVKRALNEIVKDEKLGPDDLIAILASDPKKNTSTNFFELCYVKDYLD